MDERPACTAEHVFVRGPDISRGHGSWRLHICARCCWWRTLDHHGNQKTALRPPGELAQRLVDAADDDDVVQ